jgi:hypothetical protein
VLHCVSDHRSRDGAAVDSVDNRSEDHSKQFERNTIFRNEHFTHFVGRESFSTSYICVFRCNSHSDSVSIRTVIPEFSHTSNEVPLALA